MGVILIFILLVVGIIVYYNIKNKYQANHPKKCDFCGKDFPNPTKLLDGYICDDCLKIEYGDKKIDLHSYLINFKKGRVSVSNLKEFMNLLNERGEIEKGFVATRISPSGAIIVDDNLGLFVAGAEHMPRYARRISDIEGFKLVIERNWDDMTTDSAYITGGHLEIKLSELFDELIVSIPVDQKIIGMKSNVKKAFEDDIRFLEEITGKVRG